MLNNYTDPKKQDQSPITRLLSRPAAINGPARSGNRSGLVRTEITHHGGYFRRFDHPSRRRGFQKYLTLDPCDTDPQRLRLGGDLLFNQRRTDICGTDHIRGNLKGPSFESGGLRQPHQPMFGGDVACFIEFDEIRL